MKATRPLLNLVGLLVIQYKELKGIKVRDNVFKGDFGGFTRIQKKEFAEEVNGKYYYAFGSDERKEIWMKIKEKYEEKKRRK